MWELDYKDGWALKNWCFWTVVLEKTLDNPLDYKESKQSILKEMSPECSWEGLMLKLKLPILWPPDVKNWFIGKDPDVGKDWNREEKGRMRWLDDITDSWTWVWVSSGSWWWTGKPGVLQSMGSQRVGHDWATGLNWTYQYYMFWVWLKSQM